MSSSMATVTKPQGDANTLVGIGNHKKRMTPHESERELITWRIGQYPSRKTADRSSVSLGKSRSKLNSESSPM